MRLIGVGTDIVSIPRVEAALSRRGDGFARRILHPEEWTAYRETAAPSAFLARRFAAKEAVAKALGVGLGGDMGLRDARVCRDPRGKPLLRLSGRGRETARRLG
ncbi:MAG: holo-ACP synthase, partial [Ectothiorhodospira sp.]